MKPRIGSTSVSPVPAPHAIIASGNSHRLAVCPGSAKPRHISAQAAGKAQRPNATPAIGATSIAITAAYAAGFLEPLNTVLSPITVLLLGLPAMTGVVFVFGIIRKEMTILALAALFGTTVFSTIMTPVQLIVFGLVAMLYAPCISTILALAKEFSWKQALAITALETGLAILFGAIAFRLLGLFV